MTEPERYPDVAEHVFETEDGDEIRLEDGRSYRVVETLVETGRWGPLFIHRITEAKETE